MNTFTSCLWHFCIIQSCWKTVTPLYLNAPFNRSAKSGVEHGELSLSTHWFKKRESGYFAQESTKFKFLKLPNLFNKYTVEAVYFASQSEVAIARVTMITLEKTEWQICQI